MKIVDRGGPLFEVTSAEKGGFGSALSGPQSWKAPRSDKADRSQANSQSGKRSLDRRGEDPVGRGASLAAPIRRGGSFEAVKSAVDAALSVPELMAALGAAVA